MVQPTNCGACPRFSPKMNALFLLLLLSTSLFSYASVVSGSSPLINALIDHNATTSDLISMADEHPELLHLKDGSGRLPITVAYESGNLQAFVQLIARNSPI